MFINYWTDFLFTVAYTPSKFSATPKISFAIRLPLDLSPINYYECK